MEYIKLLEHEKIVKEGFLFAMFTDHIDLKNWPVTVEEQTAFDDKKDKLLDVRIFDETKEIRMFRGDVGKKEFFYRVIDDEQQKREYFDEEQYLDIDDQRSEKEFEKNRHVFATGGGRYPLPLSDYRNVKVCIRNYIAYYEETGQAYVRDWRLAGLFNEKA